MNTVFEKLSDSFKVDWDIDDIASKIANNIVDPNQTTNTRPRPYSDPSGLAHWQVFSLNIAFARNFYKNFSIECEEVAHKLIQLQSEIDHSDNPLVNRFLDHKPDARRVNVIRTIGGSSVPVHCDITRDTCINIGLRNSNTFRTVIGYDSSELDFYNKPTQSYTMNDGDAYLISIKNAHCVESLTTESLPRYIITYNMM
jgi:hypothetical protein